MKARDIAELIVEKSRQSGALVPNEWSMIERFDVVGYLEKRLAEANINSMEAFEERLRNLMAACEIPKMAADRAGVALSVRLVVPFAQAAVVSMGGIDDHLRDLACKVQLYTLPSEDAYATLVARVVVGFLQVAGWLDVV